MGSIYELWEGFLLHSHAEMKIYLYNEEVSRSDMDCFIDLPLKNYDFCLAFLSRIHQTTLIQLMVVKYHNQSCICRTPTISKVNIMKRTSESSTLYKLARVLQDQEKLTTIDLLP